MIKIFIHLIVLITSIVSTFYCLNNNTHYGYDYIWVLPFLFFAGYTIFYIILNQKYNTFILLISVVIYVRFVLLSFLLVYTGHDVSRSSLPPAESSYNLAVVLMSMEMIAIFIVNFFLISKLNFSYKTLEAKPLNGTKIYTIFIFLCIVAFIVQPELWSRINFIIPEESTGNRNELTIIGSVTYFALNIARYLIIVIITSKLSKLYFDNNSGIFIFLNFIVAVLLGLIIFGHNRADFLIGFLAILFFMQIVYKKKAIIYNVFFILLAPLVIFFITRSREAISADSNLPFIESITSTLQAYLGGIYNVAIAVETRNFFGDNNTFLNLLFDIFRPFLGLNIFFQDTNATLTNHLFNQRIYGLDHVSQILPSVGHGYFYFGVIFSPVLTIILLLIAKYLIKKSLEIKRMDIIFFFLIPIFRLSLSPAQNISIMMNDLSSILVIFIPLYLLSNFLISKEAKGGP